MEHIWLNLAFVLVTATIIISCNSAQRIEVLSLFFLTGVPLDIIGAWLTWFAYDSLSDDRRLKFINKDYTHERIVLDIHQPSQASAQNI